MHSASKFSNSGDKVQNFYLIKFRRGVNNGENFLLLSKQLRKLQKITQKVYKKENKEMWGFSLLILFFKVLADNFVGVEFSETFNGLEISSKVSFFYSSSGFLN